MCTCVLTFSSTYLQNDQVQMSVEKLNKSCYNVTVIQISFCEMATFLKGSEKVCL